LTALDEPVLPNPKVSQIETHFWVSEST